MLALPARGLFRVSPGSWALRCGERYWRVGDPVIRSRAAAMVASRLRCSQNSTSCRMQVAPCAALARESMVSRQTGQRLLGGWPGRPTRLATRASSSAICALSSRQRSRSSWKAAVAYTPPPL
jgi:hypothetical protein